VIFTLAFKLFNETIGKDSWDKFLGIIKRSPDTVKAWKEEDLRKVLNSTNPIELSSLSELEKVDVLDFWKTLQGIILYQHYHVPILHNPSLTHNSPPHISPLTYIHYSYCITSHSHTFRSFISPP
jgi:hypothetical protein